MNMETVLHAYDSQSRDLLCGRKQLEWLVEFIGG